MECRDVRPLLGSVHALAGTELTRVLGHVETCAACRDELAEPVGVALATMHLPIALPPPDFTRAVLRRLPETAPVAIARREQRARRFRRNIAITVGTSFFVLAILGLSLLHFVTIRAGDIVAPIGLPLALIAKALLDALAEPIVVIVALALLGAGSVWMSLGRGGGPRRNAGRGALAGAALAALLVVNAAGARRDTSFLRADADVEKPADASVTSLSGDLRVRGVVAGDVVSLLGSIHLEPGANVRGSVMSAAGSVTVGGRVAGAVIEGPSRGILLSSLIGGQTAETLQPELLTGLVAVLAAVMSLLLAALLIVVRPRMLLDASHYLARAPGRACILGLGAALGLFVLAMGGSVLLAASIIGVVLVPVLLLLLHLPFVVGVAAIGDMLGSRLAGRPSVASGLWGVGAQMVVVVAIALWTPWLALSLFYRAGSIGLGGALLAPLNGALEIA